MFTFSLRQLIFQVGGVRSLYSLSIILLRKCLISPSLACVNASFWRLYRFVIFYDHVETLHVNFEEHLCI